MKKQPTLSFRGKLHLGLGATVREHSLSPSRPFIHRFARACAELEHVSKRLAHVVHFRFWRVPKVEPLPEDVDPAGDAVVGERSVIDQ
eukprot:4777972-Heterocapsa_arctica.AAC.1